MPILILLPDEKDRNSKTHQYRKLINFSRNLKSIRKYGFALRLHLIKVALSWLFFCANCVIKSTSLKLNEKCKKWVEFYSGKFAVDFLPVAYFLINSKCCQYRKLSQFSQTVTNRSSTVALLLCDEVNVTRICGERGETFSVKLRGPMHEPRQRP